MTDNKETIYTLTRPVVTMFPALFEPKTFKGKGGGEPKFEDQFFFDPDSEDWQAMKALAVKVAKSEAPTADLKTLSFPFKSGAKAADKRKAKGKEDAEWQRGKGFITARSKFQPNLGVFENGRIIELDTDELKQKYKNKFYSGAECYAEFNFVWWETPQGRGVTAYLNKVLSTGKGKRIGGGGSVADAFKAYVGQASAEDPTEGIAEDLDDDIPF